MSALRLSAIVLLSQALSADAALAADPPRPPQPPLTDATLHEWSAELQSLHALRDNEFLFDEKAAAFENQVAACQPKQKRRRPRRQKRRQLADVSHRLRQP